MKKIHIKKSQGVILEEDAKVVSLFGTDLGEFFDDEEEKYVKKVSEKYDELIKGLFDLKEYIDNTEDYIESERAEREIEIIKNSLETLLNG